MIDFARRGDLAFLVRFVEPFLCRFFGFLRVVFFLGHRALTDPE
jgi:hypothetical protein